MDQTFQTGLPKKNKKYRLGLLTQLDLGKLIETIEDCLVKYTSCGIQLTEKTAGSGALYKSRVHGAKFKNATKQRQGPFVV